MAVAVRECQGCGRDFAPNPGPGRPRSYCYDCRPTGGVAPVVEPAHVDAQELEVSKLEGEADALEREADQMATVAKAKRAEAAKLRARADRVRGWVEGARVRRAPTALDRVRDDGLLAAAGLASEDLPVGFVARDLAALLGIADVPRAMRLLAALVELGKVVPHGDGFLTCDPDEIAVRDYVVATGEFSMGDAVDALGLPEMAVAEYLARLGERGLVEGAGGFFRYVAPADTAPRVRPRRRPPELDPPAGADAPKRGEPVRIVDHGQGAAAGGKHKMKLKQQAWERQENAREARAEEQRAKARQGGRRGRRS